VHFVEALMAECDSAAQLAWPQLAFLTCNRLELKQRVNVMLRPILLRIDFPADEQVRKFKIPFMEAAVVCVDVDWGDGSIDKLRGKGDGFVEHTYSAAGEFAVRIFPAHGDCAAGDTRLDHLGFNKKVLKEDTMAWWTPLKEIVSLGKCGLRSLSYLFAHSRFIKADLCNLPCSEIQNMSGMFYRALAFNQPIGNWDVSNVTDMSFMFHFTSKFNQNIEEWNVSNVVDMSGMFSFVWAFNQPIGDWDVSHVENMSFMFASSSSFNQPIEKWNVGKVSSMRNMFCGAHAFNQDISEWSIGHVFDKANMFLGARALKYESKPRN
jgi:surface protein